MPILGRPAVVASLSVAWAAILLPPLQARVWLPGAAVVSAALGLLLLLGLMARLPSGPGAQLTGLGALLLLAALAGDGALGRRGSLTLAPGQALNRFEEEGPEGRPLGLRPLGFEVGLERAGAAGLVLLRFPPSADAVALTRGRAVGHGGFRLGEPREVPTGEAARLRIGVGRGGQTREVEITPSEPGHVDGLEVALERYFADFALDEKGQPFSRSSEPRNPAALLRVEEGGRSWRVFVIRSLPGIHVIETLGRSFALQGVEPEVSVRIRVSREPAAPLAAGGVLLLAGGLALSLRRP